MKLQVYSIDCSFVLDCIKFHIFQISRGTVAEVPAHSHGAGNYEIHYLSSGSGTAKIVDHSYAVETNTLYMTGPFVEHSQFPSRDSPLVEYCINLQAEETDGWKKNALSDLFFSNPAWFGQDRQNLLPLLQQIFRELEEKRLGYAGQISALLAQCMIALVRNYEMALQPESCKKARERHQLPLCRIRRCLWNVIFSMNMNIFLWKSSRNSSAFPSDRLSVSCRSIMEKPSVKRKRKAGWPPRCCSFPFQGKALHLFRKSWGLRR